MNNRLIITTTIIRISPVLVFMLLNYTIIIINLNVITTVVVNEIRIEDFTLINTTTINLKKIVFSCSFSTIIAVISIKITFLADTTTIIKFNFANIIIVV